MKTSFLIGLITILFVSCKNKTELKNILNPYDEAANTASRVKQTAAACACAPVSLVNSCNASNNPNPAIQAYLGTASSKTFVITWTNCTESNSNFSPGCGVPLSGVTSTLILCYAATAPNPCNMVNAHFIGKPECLPCMPADFCIDLLPSTSGNNYVLQGTYNNETLNNLLISVAISADPDVQINCTSGIGSQNPVSYSCFGNF